MWAVGGHEGGKLWTIDEIYLMWNDVNNRNLSEKPQHIRGCRLNLELVEERVEKVSSKEASVRNRGLYVQKNNIHLQLRRM